jgi:hypothetical protein
VGDNAYIRFATKDAALMELMFAAKSTGQSAALRRQQRACSSRSET